MIRHLFLILIISAAVAQDLYSQDAFSEIRVTLTGNKLMAGNTLLRSWDPNAGLGLELSTPYHVGNLEAGYRYLRFNEIDFEGSAFHSHYLFFGWSYSYRASDEVALVYGVRFGKQFMLHDEDMFYDDYRFSREESEFSYELQIRLEYEISRNVELYLGTAYNRTIFNIPLAAYYGTAGLTFKFPSSRWFRTVME